MSETTITVLMPAYNAEKYIVEAIDSILLQTYPHFAFLIINDASIDSTEKIILSYNDKRIKYVKNEVNSGISATLNKGIELTATEYLVRMDADDISTPDRLKELITYMNEHKEVGVCGSFCEIFGDKNEIKKLPLHDDEIKATMLFETALSHPSVIIRTEVLKKNNIRYGSYFNDNYGHNVLELEDLTLWNKLKHITKFANINKVLLKYRMEGQNLSTRNSELVVHRKKEFYTSLLNELSVSPTELNLKLHISFNNVDSMISTNELAYYRSYLSDIIENNRIYKTYNQQALEKIVEIKWEHLFYFLPSLGIKYLITYRKLSNGFNNTQIKYLIKHTVNKCLGRNKH